MRSRTAGSPIDRVNGFASPDFMVTQGIRDRKTLKVNYPLPNEKGPAGEDEVFAHFFAMEVTWK